jgi:hypothetical protein
VLPDALDPPVDHHDREIHPAFLKTRSSKCRSTNDARGRVAAT